MVVFHLVLPTDQDMKHILYNLDHDRWQCRNHEPFPLGPIKFGPQLYPGEFSLQITSAIKKLSQLAPCVDDVNLKQAWTRVQPLWWTKLRAPDL